jgi:hypothetical protein
MQKDREYFQHVMQSRQVYFLYRHATVARDWVWTGNWLYWTLTLVTTNNYDSLTELCIPKIIVTTAHIPLPLGSRTVPGLRYQLLTSHNSNSQLTQLTNELLTLTT